MNAAARLSELLRSLDYPEHLEFQADYDRAETRKRFGQLMDRLDDDFSCACVVERHVQGRELPRSRRDPRRGRG